MATPTLVPVEEYLRTIYHPDCDYVDGIVEEQTLGERDHAWIQPRIASFFIFEYAETGIAALTEWRFQLSPTRYRIPDIVVTRGKPDESILTKAPLLCIEILSPEDRLSRVESRVQEYLDFGVPAVWVVDPAQRKIWIYCLSGIEEAGDFVRVDGTDMAIPHSFVFG